MLSRLRLNNLVNNVNQHSQCFGINRQGSTVITHRIWWKNRWKNHIFKFSDEKIIRWKKSDEKICLGWNTLVCYLTHLCVYGTLGVFPAVQLAYWKIYAHKFIIRGLLVHHTCINICVHNIAMKVKHDDRITPT